MKVPVLSKSYRLHLSDRYFRFFVRYKYTDLAVATDSFSVEMVDFTYDLLKEVYEMFEKLKAKSLVFFEALKPIHIELGFNFAIPTREIIGEMLQASSLANVGPMAAVAGAIAQWVGKRFIERFRVRNIVVENGGDIYVKTEEKIRIGIFANFNSPFNKLAVVLPDGEYGVCTSSGKIGHSLSFGNADAVTVISTNAAIADAFATRYGNMVRVSEDLKKVTILAQEEMGSNFVGIIAILDDKIAVAGKTIRLEQA